MFRQQCYVNRSFILHFITEHTASKHSIVFIKLVIVLTSVRRISNAAKDKHNTKSGLSS